MSLEHQDRTAATSFVTGRQRRFLSSCILFLTKMLSKQIWKRQSHPSQHQTPQVLPHFQNLTPLSSWQEIKDCLLDHTLQVVVNLNLEWGRRGDLRLLSMSISPALKKINSKKKSRRKEEILLRLLSTLNCWQASYCLKKGVKTEKSCRKGKA